VNGPEVILAVLAITVLAVYAGLGTSSLVRDWRQRREVRRIDRHADARRRLSRPRSLP
jgi:hypothetical protein